MASDKLDDDHEQPPEKHPGQPPEATNPSEAASSRNGPSFSDDILTQPISREQISAEAETIASRDDAGAAAGRPAALSPGQRIGPYLIERRLGAGGMGEVYAAEHLENGHRLAVKLLASSETWSPALRQRFLREGRLAATVNHPHSLYVYGTEEIDGVPVIAMELADGGTLHDRLREAGPLPVREAVDATLQIIAGLEAAHSAGILHRDVKPSNCFVDRDGSVKIGDYGLSLPTAGAEDTRLTMTGALLATPAFAPPEQLRGEDVDVRSDIYAVGATLYCLLTGKTPLQAAGAVHMLAAVLEKMPESPRALRPEIPGGLAQVVLRCLAKKQTDRFQSYAELRRALVEFSSQMPLPAPTGTRLKAGVLDWFLYLLLSIVVVLNIGDKDQDPTAWGVVLSLLCGFAYALPEMIWGRSPGKKATGLRLAKHYSQKPDCLSVLSRTAVYFGPIFVLGLAGELVPSQSWVNYLLSYIVFFAPLFLFIPWRKSSRRLGLHDRVSGTRVILAGTGTNETRAIVRSPRMADQFYRYTLGPYQVDTDPMQSLPGQVLDGFDPTLRRRIWIVVQPPGAPPTPVARRNLARRNRLRWLNDRRAAEPSWDAYEAPDGLPLFADLNPPRPWRVVHRWLLDLAEEIEPAFQESEDAHLLSPDRVWITADNRAMLLDFPPSGIEKPCPVSTYDPALIPRHELMCKFLSCVARRALCGASDPGAGSSSPPELPLPLRISRLLKQLAAGTYTSCSALDDDLKALAHRPDTVGRRRRAFQFLVPSVLVASSMLVSVLAGYAQQRGIEREYPGYRQALYCLKELRYLERAESTVERDRRKMDLQVYLAGPLRGVIQDPAATYSDSVGSRRTVDIYNRGLQLLITDIHENISAPTEGRIAEAYDRLSSELSDEGLLRSARTSSRSIPMIALQLPLYAAPIFVFFGFVMRGGLWLTLLGIVVVTRRGKIASRWRVLVRSLITWAPLLIPWIIALSNLDKLPSSGPYSSPGHKVGIYARAHSAQVLDFATSQLYYLPFIVFVLGATYAIIRPHRGIQDRLAGTYLVRK